MKFISFRQLLTTLTIATPLFAHAGGIEIIEATAPCCEVIPNMISGWGFSIEGAALRPYDNDLIYGLNSSNEYSSDGPDSNIFDIDNYYKYFKPKYAFNLRVGLSYTFYDSGTVLQLFYEHYFNRKVTDSSAFEVTNDQRDTPPRTFDYFNEGSLRNKFDGVTLAAEQHFILGPFWESTLTGGLRFAHLSQQIELANNFVQVQDANFFNATAFNSMQFNGAGPLAGIGTIFHLNEDFAIGAEGLGALLMGRNKIGSNVTYNSGTVGSLPDTTVNANNHIDSIYSIVPEVYYRIYGNYSYLFANNTELTIELGWRGNLFFNVRTALLEGDVSSNKPPLFNSTEQIPTFSTDLGFMGPYLTVYYQI